MPNNKYKNKNKNQNQKAQPEKQKQQQSVLHDKKNINTEKKQSQNQNKKKKQYFEHNNSLPNVGNTCYLNSIFQTLFSAENFKEALCKHCQTQKFKHSLAFLLGTLFQQMKRGENMKEKRVTIAKILHWLSNKSCSNFLRDAQDDCMRFLFNIISYLEQQLQGVRNFFKVVYSETQSTDPQQRIQLQDIYLVYTKQLQKQIIEHSEQIKSENRNTGYQIKVIACPQYLFMLNTTDLIFQKQISLKLQKSQGQQNQFVKYLLISNCVYDGDGQKGHYYINRFDEANNQWTQFNDSVSSIITEQDAMLQRQTKKNNCYRRKKVVFALYRRQLRVSNNQQIILQQKKQIQKNPQQINIFNRQNEDNVKKQDFSVKIGIPYCTTVDVLFKYDQKQQKYQTIKRTLYFIMQKNKHQFDVFIKNSQHFFYYKRQKLTFNQKTISNKQIKLSFTRVVQQIRKHLQKQAKQKIKQISKNSENPNKQFIKQDNKNKFLDFQIPNKFMQGNIFCQNTNIHEQKDQIKQQQGQKKVQNEYFNDQMKKGEQKQTENQKQPINKIKDSSQIQTVAAQQKIQTINQTIQTQNNSVTTIPQQKQCHEQLKYYQNVINKQQKFQCQKKYLICIQQLLFYNKNVNTTTKQTKLVFLIYHMGENKYTFQIVNYQSIPFGQSLRYSGQTQIQPQTLLQACRKIETLIRHVHQTEFKESVQQFKQQRKAAQEKRKSYRVPTDVINRTV